MRSVQHRLMFLAVVTLMGGPVTTAAAQSAVPSEAPATAVPSPALLPTIQPLDPSTWTTYTSDRYGFSIGHPADWTEDPADHTWTMTEASVFPNPADEAFRAPGASVRVSAWSVPVDPSTTLVSWLETYCPLNTTPCTGLADRTTPVTVDGHPGTLVQFADDTQAFIPVDDRMYVVAVWEPDTDPRSAPYGGAVRLLEGYLSTMHLLPAGPVFDTPTPAMPSPV